MHEQKCSCEAHFLTLGECPDTIFSLEYSSSIRKGLGNLSLAHLQEEKDDAFAEDKETSGVYPHHKLKIDDIKIIIQKDQNEQETNQKPSIGSRSPHFP